MKIVKSKINEITRRFLIDVSIWIPDIRSERVAYSTAYNCLLIVLYQLFRPTRQSIGNKTTYMLHGNESLAVEPRTDYRVIGFLGRPRIHATKRDECQDNDGCVILQTTSDFGDRLLLTKSQRTGTKLPLSKHIREKSLVTQFEIPGAKTISWFHYCYEKNVRVELDLFEKRNESISSTNNHPLHS